MLMLRRSLPIIQGLFQRVGCNRWQALADMEDDGRVATKCGGEDESTGGSLPKFLSTSC